MQGTIMEMRQKQAGGVKNVYRTLLRTDEK